jgi:hypothetical protein
MHTLLAAVSAVWAIWLIRSSLFLSKQILIDYIELKMPENFRHRRRNGSEAKKRRAKAKGGKFETGGGTHKQHLTKKKQEKEDGNETSGGGDVANPSKHAPKASTTATKQDKTEDVQGNREERHFISDDNMKPKRVDINHLIAPMVPKVQTIFTASKIVLCFVYVLFDKHHILFQIVFLSIVGIWIVLNHRYQPLLGDNAVPNTLRTCGFVILFLGALTNIFSMVIHHLYGLRGNDDYLIEFERNKCGDSDLQSMIIMTWFVGIAVGFALVPITWFVGYSRAQGVLDYLDWKKVVWNGEEKRRTKQILGNMQNIVSLFHLSEPNILGIVFALDSVIPHTFFNWDAEALTITARNTDAYKFERLVDAAVASKRDIVNWALEQSERPTRSMTDSIVSTIREFVACYKRAKRHEVYVVNDDTDIQDGGQDPVNQYSSRRVSKERSHPTWYATSRSLLAGATYLDLSNRGLGGGRAIHFWRNVLIYSLNCSYSTKRFSGWITTHVQINNNAIREVQDIVQIISLCATHLPMLQYLDVR